MVYRYTQGVISPPASAAARAAGHSAGLWRARIAVYLTFFANGVGFSNLVPRYPEIIERLGITKAAFGQAVMCGSIGALVAGLAASWFIRRFTSARVASTGMIVLGLGLIGAATAPSWIVLALCLAWTGATDAIIDVAQNAHGLRVERRWGSSIITSFHAAWSLGAVVGALMGQRLAGWGVPLTTHMVGVLVLLAVVSLAARPMMIPGPDSEDRRLPGRDHSDAEPASAQPVAQAATEPVTQAPIQSQRQAPVPSPGRMEPAASRPTTQLAVPWVVTIGVVIILGLLCAAAMFPEDVTANWSSLLLTEQDVNPSWRGMGMVALQTTMIAGRLVGDGVIDRLGTRAVIGGGGVLVAAGMGLALLTANPTGTIGGMVLAGAGCAVAVPVAYAAADDVPGLRPGVGLTIVSWLARVVMMVSPPVVGWFADTHGTWVALVYGLLGGLIMAISWPVLPTGPRSDQISQAPEPSSPPTSRP